MIDLIKKTMLAGIGLALKTKDEVEDLANELVKMGKVSEKEGKKFLNDILKKYDDAQLKLEKRVEQALKELLKKGDIVTGEELKALKKEVREIKRAISKNADPSE